MIVQLSRICFVIALLFGQMLLGEDFGYIYTETWNIGDDIQSVAAERFLPHDSIPIDRELVSCFFFSKTNPNYHEWLVYVDQRVLE